jgi:phosphatidylserine synthase
MSGSSDDRLLVGVHWPWRVVVFTALVVLILGLEQLLQSRLIPSAAAALAVQQLQASDLPAESLRTFEWSRQALPIVAWGLIVVVGCVTFVPMPRRWVRWLRRTFA